MITLNNIFNRVADSIISVGAAAGIGYLSANVFTTINPIHATIIGAVSVIVYEVTRPLFERIFANIDTKKASQFLGSIINLTGSVAVTTGVAYALGFPLTAQSFLYMNAVTIAALSAVTLGVLAIGTVGSYLAGTPKQ